MKLDPDQQKAVEHLEGPALVVAGPGSGKTTVIENRILRLIGTHKVPPSRILALAFNKEAKEEMENRILPKLASRNELPEIRTLHGFGLSIIKQHYKSINYRYMPGVWGGDPERTIKQESQQLKKELDNTSVTIYKVESKVTGKCYIGQTINPERREKEHFNHSSNPDLHQAILNEGRENFKFVRVAEIKGKSANRCESHWIKHYRNRSVVNLLESEALNLTRNTIETRISIYKVESKKTGRSYIVQSTDPERSKVEDFISSSNEELCKVIEKEGAHQFIFKVLYREILNAEVPTLLELAIEDARNHSRAVFNRNDPLKQRYGDQLMIELFCEHFKLNYEGLLKNGSNVENLVKKIEDFEKIVGDVEKAKRQVDPDLYNASSINNLVDLIVYSIDDLVTRAFAEKYEKKKREANSVDFQDMILYSAYLFKTYPDILQEYREKYSHVIIDEFQDVSPIDFQLIDPLSENTFAVGDDDQAIFGFRGGDSKIMLNFHKRENVKEYKITRNYRSTSTIVKHSKALIEHNMLRISKRLQAHNPMHPPVKVLETIQEIDYSKTNSDLVSINKLNQMISAQRQHQVTMAENTLMRELDNPTCHAQSKDIAILVRYRFEVDQIRKMLLRNGFEEVKVKTDKPRKKGDPFNFTGGDYKKIRGSTIHKVKGKEYEKVILIHNTLGHNPKLIRALQPHPDRLKSLLWNGNFPSPDIDELEKQEERRVFYTAMTRAKQELVIFGGTCQFIPELQNVPFTKEDMEEAFREELVAREPKLKIELEEASEAALATLESRREKEIEKASKAARKQHEPDISRLRRVAAEAENAKQNVQTQIIERLPQQLTTSNNALLEELIPVLDMFESQLNSMQTTVESNDRSDDFVEFTKSAGLTQEQLLDLFKHHDLKPIETSRGMIFNPVYHEKISPAIYSDEVPANSVAIENRRGYLLDDRVIRKAQVTVSKGRDLWTPARLDWIVERYIDRLMFEFQNKYQLGNIDRAFVKLSMVQYLMGLDNDSIGEIDSFAVMNKRPSGHPELYANYCVGPEKTYLCTDVLCNFWKRMWKIVERSRRTPEIQIEKPSVRASSKVFTDGEIVKGIVVSKKITDQTLIWDKLAIAHETGVPMKGHITERIKGGLRVSVGALRGFLPASQVELRPIQNLEQYVGQTLDMKVISLNKQEQNIVLSRRAWLEAELVQKRAEILSTLEVGQCVTGVVKNITAFGAFVDLGGIDSLLHKSEMAWKRINHPSDVVSVGETIEVQVIAFDEENEKISLGLKQMSSDPWANIEDKYPVGSTVRGTITNIVHYGAFFELEEAVEGLIHISEMSSTQRNIEPSHLVNKGDEVEAMVIEISKDSRRISLSIKQCQQNPFEVEGVEPSTDKPTPMLEIESERSDESPKLRVIKPMNKTVEAIPMANGFSLAPETHRIPLYEPINLIIPEPVEKVVNTPPPMSKEYSEIFDRYLQELKPDILKSVETGHAPLYESIDLIVPEPIKKIVDSRLPMPKGFLETPNSQIQNLTPETLEIEITLKPLETVNSNARLTLQEYEDILKKQIQDIKSDALEPDIVSYPPIAVNNSPQETLQEYEDILKEQIQDIKSDTSESENPDNITQEPTMETEVNRAPVDSTALTRSEPSTVIDSNASQIKEQDIPENKVEDVKKSLGHYLSRGGRFAIEKIKAAIFRKPSS